MDCPKCGAPSPDPLREECSHCGIVFAKWAARLDAMDGASHEQIPVRSTPGRPVEPAPASRFAVLVLGPGAPVHRWTVLGRAVLWIGFAVWSWSFISQPMGTAVLDSFIHVVNLVFHEAGHIIFIPLGRFMTSLGGSLMQLLVPLVCAGALLWQTRDPFGASLAMWWLGQNLLDLAPYIGDARALQLVLLGGYTGREVEGHDWEAILTTLGWLEYDRSLATAAHGLGVGVMVAALIWGAAVLIARGRRPGR